MCNMIRARTSIIEIKSDQPFVALQFVLFLTNNLVYILMSSSTIIGLFGMSCTPVRLLLG